jgi:hypothetical protein
MSGRSRPVEMRAGWSFGSKPWFATFGCGWFSERHHLHGRTLSVETARNQYLRQRWFPTMSGRNRKVA